MLMKDQLLEQFGDAVQVEESAVGDEVYVVDRTRITEVCQFMRDQAEPNFSILMDLTAVDYLKLNHKPRFAVIYHLFSLSKNQRVRIKA